MRPPTDRRSFVVAAACLALCLAVAAPARATQHAGLAEAVKATYLPKFAPFVTWPPETFPTPESPYGLCVSGDAAFAELVRRAAAGQVVGGRRFEVRVPASIDQAASCHILYLGPDGFAPAATVIEALRGRPVLTVTDDGAGAASGVINFVLEAGRVRFEIDARLADQNRIAISSRVLELAVRVKKAALEGAESVPS